MDLARLAWMSRRRRRRHERRQKHGRPWGALRIALVGLVSVFLLFVVSFFALFGYIYARVAAELPELGQYSAAELAQTSVVYDSRGNVVDELYGFQNRFVVGLDEIAPTLRDAVVAVEDHRFRPRISRNNRRRSTGRPRSTANQSPTTIQPTGSRSRSGLPAINPWL